MSSCTPPWRMRSAPGSARPAPRCRAAARWPPSRGSASTRWMPPTRCWPPRGWPSRARAAAFMCKRPTVCCTAGCAAPPRRPPLPPRPSLRRCTIFRPAAWIRRFFRRAAGGASRRSCSTSGPSCCSAARCRAMPRCARRSRRICQATAVSSVPRSRSWWAPASSICSAALHICSRKM